MRRNVPACVYKDPPIKLEQSDPPQSLTSVDKNLLQAIPEAKLLRADVMLTLSRDVFMNRSPTLPSPWAHWSEYKSEFSDEPAIYRTAFNDFHTLVVSVTKRLTQTAIMQATSRLRSQRRRTSKGVQPWVKRRDVLAAIDVLGMKRNGKKRWIGVAKRCSLEVVVGSMTRGGKSRRTVSWDEVERCLRGGPEPSLEAPKSDVQTPLPLEQLGLSDLDVGSDSTDDYGSTSEDSDQSIVDEKHPPSENLFTQNRDQSGRFSNARPGEPMRTTEEFDQEASQKEEQALWEMLRIVPPSREENRRTFKNKEKTVGDDERIITDADEWRAWTEYKAEWEEFHLPVPATKQKHYDTASAKNLADSDVIDSSSEEDTHKRRHRHRAFNDVEPEARGRRVNATRRESISISSDQDQASGSSSSDSENAKGEVFNQSIESDDQIPEASDAEPEMDWEL